MMQDSLNECRDSVKSSIVVTLAEIGDIHWERYEECFGKLIKARS